MLKPSVGCSRIDKESHCQLMNMAKALKRSGIQDLPFIFIELDENMYRISDFVHKLCHEYKGFQSVTNKPYHFSYVQYRIYYYPLSPPLSWINPLAVDGQGGGGVGWELLSRYEVENVDSVFTKR